MASDKIGLFDSLKAAPRTESDYGTDEHNILHSTQATHAVVRPRVYFKTLGHPDIGTRALAV